MMPADRQFAERRQQLKAEHRRQLKVVSQGAFDLADVARRIAHAADEAHNTGNSLSIQSQMNFLTGAVLRLVKDWGVTEHMQKFQTIANQQREGTR